MSRERIGLALGSGGWKGLAHLGVLRALEELEIRPAVYAGSSVGALFAAAAASRVQLSELERLAIRYQQQPLFRLNLGSFLRRGFKASAVFHDKPLRALCRDLFGQISFPELPAPAIISTVDVRTGTPLWWGMGGRREVPVADAVYASCAMPGLLPPGQVGSRLCIDGGIVDPLAISALDGLVHRIIVVDLDDSSRSLVDPFSRPSGSSLWLGAQSLVMRHLARRQLETWTGPPLVIIRPALPGANLLSVADPQRVIEAGYWAAMEVLSDDVETEAQHC